MKKIIYDHYGGACACCGETEIQFMSVDHVNGDGAAHRRQMNGANKGGTFAINRWLIKNEFPPGFQMLCFNCNLAKGFFGVCPHVHRATPPASRGVGSPTLQSKTR